VDCAADLSAPPPLLIPPFFAIPCFPAPRGRWWVAPGNLAWVATWPGRWCVSWVGLIKRSTPPPHPYNDIVGLQIRSSLYVVWARSRVSRVFSNDLLGANTIFQGLSNGLLARLGSGVLLALLTRLPLGLHVALDLARSTSGGGHFSATRVTPKLKRLRCPGGRSGSAISGRFQIVLMGPTVP
jgi:hypothetical protein